MSTPLLRVGLAGAGRIGQLHASVLSQLPGCQLVALADPDPQTLAAVADRHGVAERRSDALALIHDDSLALDAVVLSTPDEQHPPQVRAALARREELLGAGDQARGHDVDARVRRRNAERARNFLNVGFEREIHLSRLTAAIHRRMIELNEKFETEAMTRFQACPFLVRAFAVTHFDRLENANEFFWRLLVAAACLLQQKNK